MRSDKLLRSYRAGSTAGGCSVTGALVSAGVGAVAGAAGGALTAGLGGALASSLLDGVLPSVAQEGLVDMVAGAGAGAVGGAASYGAQCAEGGSCSWSGLGGAVASGAEGAVGWFLRAWEREEIAVGLAAGDSCRVIAARLAPGGYRAHLAAQQRARRPKPAKLAVNGELREWVEGKLALRWKQDSTSAPPTSLLATVGAGSGIDDLYHGYQAMLQ